MTTPAASIADLLQRHPLGLGTMAIGGQHVGITHADAIATLQAAHAAGVRLFDTAPQYGCGLAEDRLGQALRDMARHEVLVSTKVGKRIVPVGSGGQRQREVFFPAGHDGEMIFDYSFDGTLRIMEASLARLGVTRVDIALIHDVIRVFHGEAGVHMRYVEARDGALRALRRLQREGVVGAVGIGLKDVDIAQRFVVEAGIDVALVPGRLTLLDQSAVSSGLLAACRAHGTALLAAAPFDSGILATGSSKPGPYAYRPAEAHIIERVQRLERACARYATTLTTAALQYPRQFAGVSAVICGMRTTDDVEANALAATASIPADLWTTLAQEADVLRPGDVP
jgi:D-threo-aldose 1-dehydrogenase